MMWYSPYSSLNEWAESKSNDIENLISKWDLCKYNPTVIKPFINNNFTFEKLAKLLLLYKNRGATNAQILDLVSMCLDVLKKWVESNMVWKYSKSVTANDDNADVAVLDRYNVYLYLIELGLAYGSDATSTIVSHYHELTQDVKDLFIKAICDIYRSRDTDSYIDIDSAYGYIEDLIKQINDGRLHKDYSVLYTPSFKSDAACLLLHQVHDGNMFMNEIIDKIIDTYVKSKNYKKIASIIPDVPVYVIANAYNAIASSAYSDGISDFETDIKNQNMTAAMIAQSGYAKSDLCRVAKLCINAINENKCVISKSCEDAIINGIMEYKPANELSGIYDIDFELTKLEAITINSIATEATDDDNEDDDDEPVSRSQLGKKTTDMENDKYDSEGFDKPKPKRDFDSEYRKFKSNAERVAQSIDKVAATIKSYATGTNDERGQRKVTGNDSLTKVLTRVFATVAIFDVSKFLGILFIIVRIANSKKVTERERVKLITEIKNEIEIIDDQINSGSVETPEARTRLLKTKQNLQDALSKIQINKAQYMTAGAKQAVADIQNKNKAK